MATPFNKIEIQKQTKGARRISMTQDKEAYQKNCDGKKFSRSLRKGKRTDDLVIRTAP